MSRTQVGIVGAGPAGLTLGHLLHRGIGRGELRADIPISVTVQMLAGSVFARHASGEPEDDEWMESVVDTLLNGMEPR